MSRNKPLAKIKACQGRQAKQAGASMGYDEDQPKGQNPSKNETLEKKQNKSIILILGENKDGKSLHYTSQGC